MKASSEVIDPAEGDDATRFTRDQGGFVLPWMALMLLVLIAMAGFGVDVWNWWYTSGKVQRAADAGALAGVPFMPGNLNSSTPSATSTAVAIVNQNGYPVATVVQGVKANQLVVTVTDTVNNYFTSLLGIQTTTITRSATAEFNAPIQMGSPVGHICNDPDNGGVDKEWCNIGSPGVDKHTGDRYADYTNCSSPTYGCSGSLNTEYLEGTYIFTVDLPSVPAGGVDIQVYDGEYANGAQNCTNQWFTGQQLTDLTNLGLNDYADALTRFSTGQTDGYCTGDDATNLAGKAPQATAWLVRNSSVSPFQALQNPVVPNGNSTGGACAHQFLGYDPNSPSYWYDLLDKNNAAGKFDADFAASFHRWDTLCHVTVPGRYFIQVRSNVPFSSALQNDPTYLSKSETPPENTSIGGQNRYSVRVADGGTNNVTAGAATYALSRLPIYTNTTSASTPNFFLARLVPGGGTTGRILQLEFYDIGDVGGTTTLEVKPPIDSLPVNSISCSQWTFNGSVANAAPSGSSFNGCILSGITSANYPGGFNGVLVDVKVNVPGNYTCGNAPFSGVNDPNACWFKIQRTYSSGAQANDTTTWSASIGGDPVRLVK